MYFGRFLILFLATLFVVACLPLGDAAIKVRGQVVDERNKVYDNCLVEIRYEGKLLKTIDTHGSFEKTIVFQPTSGNPIQIRISCIGSDAEYKRDISEMPPDFGEYLDLGQIVLNRTDG